MKFFILFLSFLVLHSCASTQTKGDGYIYVQNVTGINQIDAELNAKRKILEKGLGELVEGRSQIIDAESKEKIVMSSVEGFVIDFQQIGPSRKNGALTEIDAKGKVNAKAIEDALKQRYADIGKPRFLMLIDENLNGKPSRTGQTVTENEIAAKFTEFEFLDREQFMRILAKEGGKPFGVYGDSSLENKAMQAAAEMGAEILLIGVSETKNIGEIEGSGLYSIQATLRFKFVDVGTAKILASENSTSAYPHVSPESGSVEAIKKAVAKVHPKIRDQVSQRWKRGTNIRVVFEGIPYDDFIDKDVEHTIRTIPGVNFTSVKSSSNANNMIVLEVEALFNGNMLYRKMRDRRGDFGFDFTQKEVKPSSVHIIVKK
ncbi:MAG: hypothetical protein N3A69_10590 [Leptospiraceae bacterium]|nr:hypothetical protein [Leptospiraceae bacterium]